LQLVTLAKAQVFKAAVELRLFVNAWGGAATPAENSRAECNGKNDRCELHGAFLSSSEVKQVGNEVKAQR
jgi:hypothetical protein